MNSGRGGVAVGTPNLGLQRAVVALSFRLFSVAWERLIAADGVTSTDSEVAITGRLMVALMAAKRDTIGQSGWPRIEEQSSIRSNDQSPKPDGIIDFKIIYSWDEREYFGIECKRVAHGDRHLVRHYVDEGVLRFVQGKYAKGHSIGAMLGLVLDGNLEDGADAVRHSIAKAGQNLRLTGQWARETGFRGVAHLYRTGHIQSGPEKRLRLLHYFLAIRPSTTGKPTCSPRASTKPSHSSKGGLVSGTRRHVRRAST